MFTHGLMYGSAEEREQSASALGEIVDVTTPEALRPYIIKITGPLIRTMGDKFPSQVKAAILLTLYKLLIKMDSALRSFLPQLQTTFVKALRDSHKAGHPN